MSFEAPALRHQGATHWHRVPLTQTQLRNGDYDRIRLRFERACRKAACPPYMMLWLAATADGGAALYVSPDAAAACSALLKAHRAEPCAPPSVPVRRIGGNPRARVGSVGRVQR